MEVAERKSILRAGAMLGNYRIQGFLGQGGFGVTYLALDTKLDLQVAIKEYMPEQLAARSHDDSVEPRSSNEHKLFAWGLTRFIKEAQTLARFNHPNIVRVMAVFELNETAYMVMEYERGHDLKALINKPGFRSESNLKHLVGPVLDGLAEVHRHGYIHRDIKPANILVRENGTPVLLDFGSARKAAPEQTQALTSLITVGYAPLEQYNSASGQEQGPWTDIYALAAVLYFAITGKAPVESTLRGSAVLNDRPDPLVKLENLRPAEYSLAFCRAVDWGLGFKMADRPQSIAEWRPCLLMDDDEATRIAPIGGSTGQRATGQPGSAPTPSSRRVSSANDRSHDHGRPGGRRSNTHPPPSVDHPGTTRVTGDLQGMSAVDSGQVRSLRPGLSTPRRSPAERPARSLAEQDRRTPTAPRSSVAKPVRSGRRTGWRWLILVLITGATVSGYLLWNGQWQQDGQLTLETDPRQLSSDTGSAAGADRAAADQAPVQAEEEARPAEAARVQAEAEAAAEARAQEAARAVEAARVQAEAEAAAEARAQEAARAAEAARAQAEAEAAEEAAAKTRAEEAARAAAEREARQQADEAREAAAREEARQAAEAAAAAQRRAEEQAATELPAPDPTRAISEQDMYTVQSRFSALVNAIESRDMAAVEQLTVDSERMQAYLRYLFANFVEIDAAMVNIRASRLRQTISGTLQIRHMIRSNGDRVFPPEQYRNNAVHSTRLQDWSTIQW